ncbi:MAG: P-loop NTPase [Acidobacteriota bacterium]
MDPIKATFVFEGRHYDVAAITADGLQVECPAGFADDVVKKFRRGGFAFVLHDPGTGNEVAMTGDLVRAEPATDGAGTTKAWIVTKPRSAGVPGRPDGGPESGRVGPPGQTAPARFNAGKTIAVGGGKGGVGKTIVSVNLALSLSRRKKSVTLLDGDFSNCNCNTVLGLTKIDNSIEEYLRKECTLAQITVPTGYDGLRLVCGSQNNVEALLAVEAPRLLHDIRLIAADYLLIDLGAGVGTETLELYRLADEKLVVVTPHVTSLQNAYGFIKSAFFHDLTLVGGLVAELLQQSGSDASKLHTLIGALADGHPARQAFGAVLARQRFRIVANMVNTAQDKKIVQNLQNVVGQYLRINNSILGMLSTSDEISSSVNRITPFVAQFPDSPDSREMERMAAQLSQRSTGWMS